MQQYTTIGAKLIMMMHILGFFIIYFVLLQIGHQRATPASSARACEFFTLKSKIHVLQFLPILISNNDQK